MARQVIAEMANVWDAPIVTEVTPAETWYKAEDYHQDYFRQHPLQGYCAFVVAPKVAKFRKTFAEPPEVVPPAGFCRRRARIHVAARPRMAASGVAVPPCRTRPGTG